MPMFEVAPGVQLFAQNWGSGKPLLFIHGWSDNHRVFEYQMLKLAEWGYQAIGVDLRGFGLSDKPWDGNDYDTWADDVEKVIAMLDLQEVLLIGYSMGGAVAAHYAATRQDPRVTQLALLGATMPYYASTPVIKQMLDALIEGTLADHGKMAHEWLRRIIHTHLSIVLSLWYEQASTLVSLRAALCGLEELRDRDLRPEIGNIRIPTRIFYGVHDKVVPFALIEEQLRLIPDSTLVRFEHSGHMLYYDEKDKLNEELAKFATQSQAKAA